MTVFGQKWLYSGKYGFIRLKLLYLEKSCIRSKLMYLGKGGCFRGKVDVLGKKWFYSG